MSRLSMFGLCVVAALALCVQVPAVFAEGEGAPKADQVKKAPVLHGVVKSVDAKTSTVVVTEKKGEKAVDVTVKVNEKTAYVFDGKPSTLADVAKVGAKVKVTHEEGVASKIEGKTEKKAEEKPAPAPAPAPAE